MERKNAPSKKKGGDKNNYNGGGDGDRKDKGSSGRSNGAKRQKTNSNGINMEIVSDDDHEEEGYESEPDVSTICGLCRGKLTEPPRPFHDPMLSSLAQMPPESLAIKQKYIVHKPCCSAAESGVALVQCSNAQSTMFTLSPDKASKKRLSSPRQKMACPHPNYHLACSAIPVGSRLYRDAVTEHYIKMCGNSCGKSSSIGGMVVKEGDERKMAALSGSTAGDGNNNTDIDNDEDEDDDHGQPQTHFEAEQVLRGYLCPYCDVEGTSHYLIEYFEAYRRSKTKFCQDQEAVDRVAPATELGRKFIEHVISKASSNHLEPGKGFPRGKSKILSPSKLMGIGNGGKIPAAAGTSPGLSKEEVALQTISEIQLPHVTSNEASDNTQKASNVKVIAKPRMHFRPAQIVVRSILEMLPVKKLNTFKEGDDLFALAHYFHCDFHFAVLKFDRSIAGDAGAANGGSAASPELSVTMVAADFVRPPTNLQEAIREARIDDDASLVLSISMATMEREEERRARHFHKLPLF